MTADQFKTELEGNIADVSAEIVRRELVGRNYDNLMNSLIVLMNYHAVWHCEWTEEEVDLALSAIQHQGVVIKLCHC